MALGLGIGRTAAWANDHIDNVAARNALTWVLPFVVYIVAEEIGGSGVIAIVIAAVEMNSRATLGAEDRLSGGAFWETVEMLFTGVAFGLIGLTVRDAIEEVGAELWHAVWIGVVLSAVAFIVRFAWLWWTCHMNRKRKREFAAPLRLQEVLLMAWAGMRGLVTLALVLSIPAHAASSLHHEASVIALVVLLCTMVLPGLTLPQLMKVLDLSTAPTPRATRRSSGCAPAPRTPPRPTSCTRPRSYRRPSGTPCNGGSASSSASTPSTTARS